MRYLQLSADYRDPRLCDEDSDVDVDPLKDLPSALSADLSDWNDSYQVVIPMDTAARAAAVSLIAQLDRRGLELAARIELEMSPAKVQYHSEGLLRRVP